MANRRDQAGFTLVELMVTVLVGSLVTLAATTILLLGMRVNSQSRGTVIRQNTTRVLLEALEDMASGGEIHQVVEDPDSWQVLDENGRVLFSYLSDGEAAADRASGTIYTGDGTDPSAQPLLEGVIASYITLDDKGLLSVSVETEAGSYTSSVFCRTAPIMTSTDGVGDDTLEELVKPGEEGNPPADGRTAFLQALAGQYKAEAGTFNRGLILENGYSTGCYYTEWYIGAAGWQQNGWNKDTPWCACFISWGLNEVSDRVASPENRARQDPLTGKTEYTWYSNVDYFLAYLKTNADGHDWQNAEFYGGSYTPQPGDLIFFDWTLNAQRNPEHIGAVLTVKDGCVYTIEGNSANRVAVRKYLLGDPRILGYGLLNWQ